MRGGLPRRHEVLRAVRGAAEFHLSVMRRRQSSRTQILRPVRRASRRAGSARSRPRRTLCAKAPTPGRSSTLPGEMKQVTVLFCDIVNSTPLTERLGPEGMRDLVSRFSRRALPRCIVTAVRRRNLPATGSWRCSGRRSRRKTMCAVPCWPLLPYNGRSHEGGEAADPERFGADGANWHPHRSGRLRPGRRQFGDGLHGDRRYGQCRRPTSASRRAGNDPAERGDPPAGAGLCACRAGRTAHSQRQGRADPGLSLARCFASPLWAARSAIASYGSFCRSRERARDLEQFSSAGRKRARPSGRSRRRARHRQVSAACRVPPAGRRRTGDLGRRTLPLLWHRDPLPAGARSVAQQLRDCRDRQPRYQSPRRSAPAFARSGWIRTRMGRSCSICWKSRTSPARRHCQIPKRSKARLSRRCGNSL